MTTTDSRIATIELELTHLRTFCAAKVAYAKACDTFDEARRAYTASCLLAGVTL